jgi:hypothetical protein
MGVKKKGDFFSKKRSFKEFFYPRFLIKKILQKSLKNGHKSFVFDKILNYNKELVYTSKSCRRVDLIFTVLIYTGLFRFRSSDLTFIKKRLKKTHKKKIYDTVPYNHLEKNSTKFFSTIFRKNIEEKNSLFFIIIQKYLKKRLIRNYRRRCYSLLTSPYSSKNN